MSPGIALPAAHPVPEAEIDIQRVIAHGKERIFTPAPVVPGRTDPDRPDTDLALKEINKRRCVFQRDIDILNHRLAMDTR